MSIPAFCKRFGSVLLSGCAFIHATAPIVRCFSIESRNALTIASHNFCVQALALRPASVPLREGMQDPAVVAQRLLPHTSMPLAVVWYKDWSESFDKAWRSADWTTARRLGASTSIDAIPDSEVDHYIRQSLFTLLRTSILPHRASEVAIQQILQWAAHMVKVHTKGYIPGTPGPIVLSRQQRSNLHGTFLTWLLQTRSKSGGRTLEQLIVDYYQKSDDASWGNELHEILTEITRLHAEYNGRLIDEAERLFKQRTPPLGPFRTDRRILRIGLLSAPVVRYFMRIARRANPFHLPLRGVYAGAAMDLASFLLATDSREAFFVDKSYRGITLRMISAALQNPGQWIEKYCDPKQLRDHPKYGWVSTRNGKPFTPKELVGWMLRNFQILGVPLGTVKFSHQKGHIRADFPWRYAGQKVMPRSVVFIGADITKEWKGLLKTIMEERIDLFFQKAGLRLPFHYVTDDNYIIRAYNALRTNGRFITDDIGVNAYGGGCDYLNYSSYFPELPHLILLPDLATELMVLLNSVHPGWEGSVYGKGTDWHFRYGILLHERIKVEPSDREALAVAA